MHEFESTTQEVTRTISERRSRPPSSTVPPVWPSTDVPMGDSNLPNDTRPRPIFQTRYEPPREDVSPNPNIIFPPILREVPNHPDLNVSLCNTFNATVQAVDWRQNNGYDQVPEDCEEELADIINNIPKSDIDEGVDYISVQHVFHFLTSNAVGRFILAGASCFVSAATWRLLILVATHLPIPNPHKMSLLRALNWPTKFTASLLRSTSAVARGILIGRRRSISLAPIQPLNQENAGLMVRAGQPSVSPREIPMNLSARAGVGQDIRPGVSGGRRLDNQVQGPHPEAAVVQTRRSVEADGRANGEWYYRSGAQSPPPVRTC